MWLFKLYDVHFCICYLLQLFVQLFTRFLFCGQGFYVSVFEGICYFNSRLGLICSHIIQQHVRFLIQFQFKGLQLIHNQGTATHMEETVGALLLKKEKTRMATDIT